MDAFKIPFMRLRHVILPHLAAASSIQISKHRVKVEKPKKVIYTARMSHIESRSQVGGDGGGKRAPCP
jgi:hypothetical protein